VTRLLLVRHGKTVLSGEGKYYGKQDIKLSGEGIVQAEKLRDYLAHWHIDRIYSSSLSRAVDTARIVASCHELEIKQYANMNEIDVGILDGLTFVQVKEQFPHIAEELLNWRLPHTFPEGESLMEFDERVGEFASLLRQYDKDETILVVAHAGSLRSLICHFMALGIEYWMRLHIDFTSLSIIELFSNRAVVRLLNNSSYLNGQETDSL
jgi:broad specificity phosphatase PhoE